MSDMVVDLQTPQKRLERVEQSIERWRRKPASRRQRLILAGYRRAAVELRRQIAALHTTSSVVATLGAVGRFPKTGTLPSTLPRVFRVIQNPAAIAKPGERRLTGATLRLVEADAACARHKGG